MSATRFFLALLALAAPLSADVRLPSIFGDHMILQRERSVAIWGHADPGEAISVAVSWSGFRTSTIANPLGRWRVDVTTPQAGGPYTITVRGRNEVRLDDVLIGEVWLASGQSNMEWPLERSDGGEAAIAAADDPELRLFQVARRVAARPLEEADGSWQRAASANVGSFSAVAYYFGRALRRELGVPVGLIDSTWGGTPAESWTSAAGLRRLGGFDDDLDELAAQARRGDDTEAHFEAEVARWRLALDRAEPGSGAGGWWQRELALDGWSRLEVPGLWQQEPLVSFDGYVWLRHAFRVPPTWTRRDTLLELGPIDDEDATWVNGKLVGALEGGGHWETPRRYRVPAGLLREGENVIAIRVLDTGGAGGLNGSPDALRLHPEDEAEAAIGLAGTWWSRRGLSWADTPRRPRRDGDVGAGSPTALFNGMIAPLSPFGVRGFLWYQGESNRGRALRYRALFPNLIGDWREVWEQGDLPFLFVQIAPFRYQGGDRTGALVREAQLMALSRAANTGMASTMDIGDPDDIHPREKAQVGERLARWALARTYGRRDVVASGPLYRTMARDGSGLRIHFDFAADGLFLARGTPHGFEIAGTDRRFHPAEVRLDGATAWVWSPEVPTPVAVRYAFTDAPVARLFNSEGLPASSFRTDGWELDGGE